MTTDPTDDAEVIDLDSHRPDRVTPPRRGRPRCDRTINAERKAEGKLLLSSLRRRETRARQRAQKAIDAYRLTRYARAVVEEDAQRHLDSPEVLLHIVSCLKFHWLAEKGAGEILDLRESYARTGTISEADAVRVLVLTDLVGLQVPTEVMPPLTPSPELRPEHRARLAQYLPKEAARV